MADNISIIENSEIYHCIYQITNLINGKTYIGKKQYSNRKNPLGGYYGSGKLIKASIAKYGKENFKREILVKDIKTEKEICELERKFIREAKEKGKAEYNLQEGGTGGCPYKYAGKESFERWMNINRAAHQTDQARENLSKGLRAFYRENPDEKEKMSIRLKKMYENSDYKQRWMEINKKAHQTESCRENLSKGLKAAWNNMPEDRYKEICKKRKEIANSPEFIKKQSLQNKERYAKFTEEDWAAWSATSKKTMSNPEMRKNISENVFSTNLPKYILFNRLKNRGVSIKLCELLKIANSEYGEELKEIKYQIEQNKIPEEINICRNNYLKNRKDKESRGKKPRYQIRAKGVTSIWKFYKSIVKDPIPYPEFLKLTIGLDVESFLEDNMDYTINTIIERALDFDIKRIQ